MMETAAFECSARFLRRDKFRSPGECLIAEALDQALSAQRDVSTRVVCNAIVPAGRGSCEVDLIVVGPFGVVAVEAKYWVDADVHFAGQRGCLRDGAEEDVDPRNQAALAQRCINGLLRQAGLRFEFTVDSAVIIADDRSRITGRPDPPCPAWHLTSGVRRLVTGTWGRRQRERKLDALQIDAIVKVLLGAAPQEFRRSIRHFQLRGHLGSEPHEEFAAVRLVDGGPVGEQVRLQRHFIGIVSDRRERQRRQEVAHRNYSALRALAKVPGVPIPNDIFVDPKDDAVLWTVYQHVPGSPLDSCKDRGRILNSLALVAQTLAACHRAGVIHRGLTLDCLWLPQRDPQPLVVHWDLSHIDGQRTIASRVVQDRRSLVFCAPEVRGAPARASVASDVYSLGAVAIELLTGAPLLSPQPEAAAHAAKAIGPPSLSVLLQRMLSPYPDQRPKDMTEVHEAMKSALES